MSIDILLRDNCSILKKWPTTVVDGILATCQKLNSDALFSASLSSAASAYEIENWDALCTEL